MDSEFWRRTRRERFFDDFRRNHLNRAGDRGFITFDKHWAGGAVRVRRDNGSWRAEVFNEWVT